MPTTVALNDHLAEKITALAADVDLPLDAFVERFLEALTDPGFVIRDGIPGFRLLADASVLTTTDVDRLLHSDH